MHRDAHVTGAINHDVSTWSEVIGLQVEGRAIVLEGEERLKALETYLDKFPDVRRLFDRPRDASEKIIADRLQRAPFWRMTPSWIRLIDSTKGFGWKWEAPLPLPQPSLPPPEPPLAPSSITSLPSKPATLISVV